jgi:hypothetical protein
VASLAHLETIRKEVEAGWTMQAVNIEQQEHPMAQPMSI